jgi:Tol biopolymer transport system component
VTLTPTILTYTIAHMITKLLLAASLAILSSSSVLAQATGPEIFAPGVISGPANDLSPAFTPDGRIVVFTRSNSSQSTIMISHMSGGMWSKPEIAPFSGEWRDLEPTMAPDGSYLIFISNRPASSGGKPLDGFYNGAAQPAAGGNLWRVDRTARGWGAPHRLPDIVNSNTSIYSPSIAGDGSIYFMRPTGAKTRFHLFRAQLSNGTFATPVAVPVSGSEDVGDYDPAVAPDESFLVFSSARLPDKGTSLFIALHKNGVWSTPEYMGDTVSIPHAGNIEARLGPDHRTLYFSSTHVEPALPHQDHAQSERGLECMTEWNNGLANIWSVSLSPWIAK